jgi:hypothetical protein
MRKDRGSGGFSILKRGEYHCDESRSIGDHPLLFQQKLSKDVVVSGLTRETCLRSRVVKYSAAPIRAVWQYPYSGRIIATM